MTTSNRNGNPAARRPRHIGAILADWVQDNARADDTAEIRARIRRAATHDRLWTIGLPGERLEMEES